MKILIASRIPPAQTQLNRSPEGSLGRLPWAPRAVSRGVPKRSRGAPGGAPGGSRGGPGGGPGGVQEGVRRAPGGGLGVSWCPEGAREGSEADLGPIWGPTWGPLGGVRGSIWELLGGVPFDTTFAPLRNRFGTLWQPRKKAETGTQIDPEPVRNANCKFSKNVQKP